MSSEKKTSVLLAEAETHLYLARRALELALGRPFEPGPQGALFDSLTCAAEARVAREFERVRELRFQALHFEGAPAGSEFEQALLRVTTELAAAADETKQPVSLKVRVTPADYVPTPANEAPDGRPGLRLPGSLRRFRCDRCRMLNRTMFEDVTGREHQGCGGRWVLEADESQERAHA